MRTLYLDMDGVVADFNAHAQTLLAPHAAPDENARWPDELWIKLKNDPRMYASLAKTPYADQLVDYCTGECHRRGWRLLFLSAVPKNNDVPWAFCDKVAWARIRYPWIPVHFGPYSVDKHKHAKPGDILIDDRRSNIEQWRAADGIAIHHTDFDQTMVELKEILMGLHP